MNLSLSERLIVPIVLGGIYALLSGGWMISTRGGSLRIRIVWAYSVVFIVGSISCMAWHDVLTETLGWQGAWIGAMCILACLCVIFCGRSLATRRDSPK